jgi:hypothetical protein
MAPESIYLSEQAIVTLLLSAVEAYENKEMIFHGEYFSDIEKKKRFKEPLTVPEALRFVDKRKVRADLFIERGYRKWRRVPAESIGYILGNRDGTKLVGQLLIPYQIAERELDRVTPLASVNPQRFKETLTIYSLVGGFHTHPWIYPKEKKKLEPNDASLSKEDKKSLVEGRAEIIVALVKNNVTKEWKNVGKNDSGYWGSLSSTTGESYEIIIRAWRKPGNKNDEIKIQCPYIEGIGNF